MCYKDADFAAGDVSQACSASAWRGWARRCATGCCRACPSPPSSPSTVRREYIYIYICARDICKSVTFATCVDTAMSANPMMMMITELVAENHRMLRAP